MTEEIKNICKKHGFVGGVLILQKSNSEGQNISQFGLGHQQIRECLSIATYYNEKNELEANTPIGTPTNLN